MYTCCPSCHAWFRVSAEQLRAAQGRARCGQCDAVFDALAALTDRLPAGREEIHPAAGDTGEAVAEENADTALALKAEAADDPVDDDDPPEPFQLEDWIPGDSGSSWHARLAWTAGIILLTGALVFQYIAWNLPHWGVDPDQRQRAEQLCTMVPAGLPWQCQLPPLTDLARLELTRYELTAHPEQEDGLHFSGILTNRADFAQPYPLLYITMEDRRGEVVAVGHFGPADYLGTPVADNELLEPDAQTPVSLDLTDPGEQATGFRFDFHSAGATPRHTPD